MPRRPLKSLTALMALSVATPALAGDLTPEQVGAIQYDEQKAMDKVDQAHGGRTPVEMSPDERREVMAEKQAAKQQVVEKHGADMKEYVVRSSKMSTEDQQRATAAQESLRAQDEAAKRAAEKKAAEEQAKKEQEEAPRENVEIRRGFGDEEPVDVTDEDEYDQGPDDAAMAEGTDEASAASSGEAAPDKPEPAKKAATGHAKGKAKKKSR